MSIELMLPCEGRKNHVWLHFHEDFYCELGSQRSDMTMHFQRIILCVCGGGCCPPHTAVFIGALGLSSSPAPCGILVP